MDKQAFFDLCIKKYLTYPDFPWDGEETAVFRHNDNKKWFALVMNIQRSKLGLNSNQKTDVINLKIPTDLLGSFTCEDAVYPAYHMNKAHWISVILEDASDKTVNFLLNASYEATAVNKMKRKND